MGWRKYAAGAAGFTLGGIVANVPGAIAGGYYGYKKAEMDEETSPEMSTPASRRRMSFVRTPGRRYSTSSGSSGGVFRRLARTAYYGNYGGRGRGIYRGRLRNVVTRNYRVNNKKRKRGGPGGPGGPKAKKRYLSKRRKAKVIKNFEGYCLKNGYLTTKEVFGTVEDPDCVFLSHNTFSLDSITFAVTAAFLRKLFTLAGIDVTNNKSGINITFSNDATGGRLVWNTFNALSGGYTSYTYDFLVNQTFDDIVAALQTDFGGPIKQFLKNSAFGQDELKTLGLYLYDDTSINRYTRVAAQINLQETYVEIHCQSRMNIQNRTQAQEAGAGNFDMDRVDNQPLKGYAYHFRHADPRLKQMSFRNDGGASLDAVLNKASTEGVTLVRAAQMIYTTFQEPPQPSLWGNMNGASKIVVQPGQIKTSTLKHVYKGYFYDLLKKMRCSRELNLEWVGVPGKCEMFALEELLRTNSTNLISVNYESEYKCGAVAKIKKRKGTFTTKMTSEEKNNKPT